MRSRSSAGFDRWRIAETYSKYRVGGDFSKVIKFLSDLQESKQRASSQLQVEWKYIFFEWNDSDAEIETAAGLAARLGVRLHLTITHTPGRSTRFRSVAEALPVVGRLAPGATVDNTFQVRSPEERALDANVVVSQQVVALLSLAVQALRAKDDKSSIHYLKTALNFDPGIECRCDHATPGDLVAFHVAEIIAKAQFPGTLSWLAAVSREYPDEEAGTRLLWRYLEVAPYAPDFDHVLRDLQAKRG